VSRIRVRPTVRPTRTAGHWRHRRGVSWRMWPRNLSSFP